MAIMNFRESLIASWYGERKPFRWLAPLTSLYSKQAIQKRAAYLSGKKLSYKAPVPIVVVGNITVGGTGKTPMILWMINFLQKHGIKVAVVSRGYGANPPQFPWRVLPEQSASLVGDEPLLIVKRSQVPLVIDPNRSKAVQLLCAEDKPDIILSDDGLQHYALARDLELVMIDNNRQLGNGYCLPMGPLREPIERLKTVDAIIYNGAKHDPIEGFAMQLEPIELINLASGERQPLTYLAKGQTINAVAGIGNPQRFFNTLQHLGWQVLPLPFADHTQYSKATLNFANHYPVLMTEKDAVKCQAFAKSNWWYLKVESIPSAAFVKWFEQKITELLPQKCL